MRNTKQAFTLVELIVVITILAILGTIAFISLQGYSSDARNTKRTNDLSSIQSSISVKQTEGASLLSFITGTGSRLSSVSVAGTGVTAGSNYEAGDVNYTALGIKTADFQDPNGDNYVIGVTTKVNGKFELAASIEQGGGSEVAKVIGNWSPRDVETLLGTISTTTITLSGSTDINKLGAGDTLSGGAVVTKVSADGMTITTSTTASAIELAANESSGLMAGTTSTVITDGGVSLPY